MIYFSKVIAKISWSVIYWTPCIYSFIWWKTSKFFRISL